jgi:hypothetical protein
MAGRCHLTRRRSKSILNIKAFLFELFALCLHAFPQNSTCSGKSDYAHLHRDPAPQNLAAKYPHVLKWIERLRGEISQDRIVLPDDDSMPASLLPVLVHISQSHIPLIKQSVEAVRLWSRDKSIGDKYRIKEVQALCCRLVQHKKNKPLDLQ